MLSPLAFIYIPIWYLFSGKPPLAYVSNPLFIFQSGTYLVIYEIHFLDTLPCIYIPIWYLFSGAFDKEREAQKQFIFQSGTYLVPTASHSS